jgi:hypothetical protein
VLNRTVVNPAARATGVQASALRYELVCGQLVGLAMMRYVLQVEPVASAPVDEIVRQVRAGDPSNVQGRLTARGPPRPQCPRSPVDTGGGGSDPARRPHGAHGIASSQLESSAHDVVVSHALDPPLLARYAAPW